MQGEYFRNILGPDKPEPDLVHESKEFLARCPFTFRVSNSVTPK